MSRGPRGSEGLRRRSRTAGRGRVALLMCLILFVGAVFPLFAPLGCDRDRKISDQHQRTLQEEED
jgi:hypothetical protein